jgi:hypothetical protein
MRKNQHDKKEKKGRRRNERKERKTKRKNQKKDRMAETRDSDLKENSVTATGEV